MDRRDFNPETYTRRNSKRLPFYDYRSSGAYFITVCTERRQRVLEIPMIRSALLEKWEEIPERFPEVRVDVFVIMPDHVHGILWLDGTMKGAPTLGKVGVMCWKLLPPSSDRKMLAGCPDLAPAPRPSASR